MPFSRPDLRQASRLTGLLLLIGLISACEKPTDKLGFDQVIGANINADSIHIPISTYTAPVDSILVAFNYQQQLTLGGYVGTRILGMEDNNYLGKSKATLVGQLLPTQLNIDFGENPVLDSVNMNFALRSGYGDTSVPMDISIYEHDQVFSLDSIYYSSHRPAKGKLLGQVSQKKVRPGTETTFNGNLAPPTLTIPLDTSYFQENFIDKGDGTFDAFTGFRSFIDYFPGIVAEVTSGDALLTTDLGSPFSSLRIHYHNEEDTAWLDLNFRQDKTVFPIHFSVFEHDYQNALIDLDNQDTLRGEDQTYVQSMGGVATALKIDPSRIDSLQKEGLIINYAFLEMPTALGTGEGAAPSRNMEILKLEGRSLGARALDFRGDGGDGALQLGRLRQNQYRFDLTRHLFSTLNSGENPTLAVVPTSRTTTANRTILRGGNGSGKRAHVVVYYTQP